MSEQWPTVFEKEVGIYDTFSRAEDEDNRLLKRLLTLVAFRGNEVLEIGCGTGKYTELIAPMSRRYVAIDSSRRMVEFARNRCSRIGNVSFVHCNAEMIPIRNLSVDVVFASWVMSGIIPEEAMDRAVKECLRVLKPDGHVWLFENDCNGEFMEMRDPDSAGWDKENVARMVEMHGFRVAEKVETKFRFRSVEEAKETMGFVLGESALNYLGRHPEPRIDHNVMILHRLKKQVRHIDRPRR